ncbi:50S ribosomal protein L4 [Candidatus Pacearchaeota archaeon CG10_big_fil_rev_8_21_14_0_10_35_219]|nr:50S ribosomal protein L4 [Candidatus Pacearchaeota archaeon]PIO07445.1 MAG: 50S ribosomal protein L4 [Candidatus Pacearchaeota archaeon CG10_big_fil_rev_8_21_14_0_10_35_219]PIZ80180.1 MAG: 50S ribosomal protein L4 [Candidatus Pacearchaeota archaeon CG_4_10_14_0_2_um_filter_35_33]
MKGVLYDLKGKKKGEIGMPELFNGRVRKDIVAKFFEADKFIQPYSPDRKAGKKHSASGTISHKRHDWKAHYGRGISRVPRKSMWRRGTQFFWVGAEIASTRGGRRAHPPKGIGKEKKINKKEIKIAFNSAFAATADKEWIEKRYSSLDKFDTKVPVIIESKLEKVKTKDVLNALKEIFGKSFNLIVKKRKVRAGKGKARGRKYKSNAGLLILKGKDENFKLNGFDVKNVNDVSISDLYPLGRLTVYTEKAIKELGETK